MATLRSKEEFYQIYKATVQAADTDHDKLTDWSEGSLNDFYAAAAATIAAELEATIVTEFSKTLISNAEGSEKDELIEDHFGESFARLDAQKAFGIVTFTRVSSVAELTIDAGTVVETNTPVGGTPQTFVTEEDTTFIIGQTVAYASVIAEEEGPEGNVDVAEITTITPAITGVTVTNAEALTGGSLAQTDPEYQEYAGNLISSSRGPTDTGIEARLKALPGIEKATVRESFQSVKNWNLSSSLPEGDPYTIVIGKVYIADANGTANSALLALAQEELRREKAAGVNLQVFAASAEELDWTVTFTLNVSGPNFASLSADPEPIYQTMRDYIENLGIGDDFIRSVAEAYVLSIWGPTGGGGTNDLVTFTSSIPSGDVTTGVNVKLIAGTMSKT